MAGIRGKVACAGAAFALLVAGCGDDGGGGEIPQETGDEMISLVEEIRSATESEECDTAHQATTELRGQVDALDDGETKDALSEMIDSLDRNLEEECPADEGPTGESGAEPEEETEDPVETTPTETTAPPTTTTTTTTEEEEPETPEQPQGEGGGGNPPLKPETPGQGGGPAPAPGGGGVEAEERGAKKPKPKKEKG